MNTIANLATETKTLTFVERILRVAVGSAFIGSIFTTASTVLHWQVMLPLLGSYAVVSGMTGVSILRSFFNDQSVLYRIFQLALSAALIGTIFIADTAPLDLVVLLPMAGIYTALGALLGQSPVNVVMEAAKAIPHILKPSDVLNKNSSHDIQHADAAKLSRVA